MVVRATLASREDGLVDTLLEVLVVFTAFSEENQTCSWATEGLVTKSTQSPNLDEKLNGGDTHVVVVTTSQWSNGLFNSCAAIKPLVWAISAIR